MINKAEVIKGPYEVAIDITYHCNYRCKHCYNASGENVGINEELSDEEFLEMIKDIAALQPYNVCFCGGEPTLRLDLLCKSAQILHDAGTPYISMVSNGFFLNNDVVKKIKNSHINRVQISLDGNCRETCEKLRGSEKAFEVAVNALKLLKKYGFSETNIAFCPTKFNIPEFEDVCKICSVVGVSEVRVQPLMLSGRAEKYKEELLPSKEQYITLLRKIEELSTLYKNKLKISWGDPLDHIFRIGSGNKDIVTYASIKANGNIPVSPYIPLSVGNVKKHKFSEYWNHGLTKAWSLDITQEMIKRVKCIDDMGGQDDECPDSWWDNDIEIDIIDDYFKK